MKTLLALSLVLAGAQAFAGSPGKAFSQGMTDVVMRLPKDPTGADLTCSSESGRTGLYAALPGDLKGTAVLIKVDSTITADIDQAYADEAKARNFDVQKELSNLAITKIDENNKVDARGKVSKIEFTSKTAKETRFSLVTVPGTTRTVTKDGGAEGTISFQGLLSTRGLKNVQVSCVEEWSL